MEVSVGQQKEEERRRRRRKNKKKKKKQSKTTNSRNGLIGGLAQVRRLGNDLEILEEKEKRRRGEEKESS